MAAPAEASRQEKTPCPERVLDLVDHYRENRSSYHASGYDEANLRKDFLNPLFAQLGWDMENAEGAAEEYKDVVVEDRVQVEGRTHIPDYSFRLAGSAKFLVEAKKPAVDITEAPEPAFQLRYYGWNRKFPLCILTNFEALAVYDTRVQPKEGDPAQRARVNLLTFEEYATRWHEIADVFSKVSILHGRFDREAKRTDRPGTVEVDEALLSEIEEWRQSLATNIKLRNQDVNEVELNYAVQSTIDRILFLRTCEDRGMEPPGQVQACAKNPPTYAGLVRLFQKSDQKYNSGLFHFTPEDHRGAADALTPKLNIDDAVLKHIIGRLYPPDSSYNFSVIPVEVLGQVYEQFLGKVIHVTEKRASVIEKPEVKKAGGVYYTPTYIVERIVRETVGRLVDGKTPEQVASMKIVDPACGSGSFLLGAYQFLLNWYVKEYAANPETWKGRIVRVGEAQYALTARERKDILLRHIYGVDIDHQAVELAKLSLLLKVLEKVPGEVLERQAKLTHERALPDLDSNIKCGNSLIDFRDLGQTLLDDAARRRVNPFDWKMEFPGVFANGGFDVVLGNPPYVRVQTMTEWAPLEVELYKRRYRAASRGNYDIYVCFVERGLSLLSRRGRLGFILPHKFFNAKYGEPLRELIASGRHLAGVIHFGDQQVFENATTYTCLLFLDKSGSSECAFLKVDDLAKWRLTGAATFGRIPAERISRSPWNFTTGDTSGLFDKLGRMPVKLRDVAARLSEGIRTSKNEVYVLEEVRAEGDLLLLRSESLNREVRLERGLTSRFLQGREIKPYQVLDSGRRLVIPYRVQDGKATLIPETELKKATPHAHAYLLENKKLLDEREGGRFRGAGWYQFGRNQNIDLMLVPKILVPDIADRAAFSLDETGEYAFTSGYGITLKPEMKESMKYLLGLLNSKLLDWYLKRVSTPLRGGFFRYFTEFVEQIPVRTIDFAKPGDIAKHDRLVGLVDQMLRLHKRLATVRIEQERTALQRQIAATELEIDRAVYELYGLTEEEVGIVEATPAPTASS